MCDRQGYRKTSRSREKACSCKTAFRARQDTHCRKGTFFTTGQDNGRTADGRTAGKGKADHSMRKGAEKWKKD